MRIVIQASSMRTIALIQPLPLERYSTATHLLSFPDLNRAIPPRFFLSPSFILSWSHFSTAGTFLAFGIQGLNTEVFISNQDRQLLIWSHLTYWEWVAFYLKNCCCFTMKRRPVASRLDGMVKAWIYVTAKTFEYTLFPFVWLKM